MRASLAFTLLTWGFAAAAAQAGGAAWGVKDEAKRFRPETVARADDEAREIQRLYHRNLLIETVPAVPEADRRRVRNMTHREADQYFGRWSRERAEALGVAGLYVLICADPKYVQVTAHPADQEEVFTEARREQLRKLLVQGLPAAGSEKSLFRKLFGARPYKGGPDQALLDAVAKVRSMLQTSFPEVEGKSDPAAPRDAALAGLILGVVGVWLVLLLVRRKLTRADAGGLAAAEEPGHVTGLLGGMFGTAAGHWVYDKLFHPSSAGGKEPDIPPADLRREATPPAGAPEGAHGEGEAGPPGADFDHEVNRTTQNIGARRLHTILERVVDDVSFQAPDLADKRVVIDGGYVRGRLAEILEQEDLTKFIL